VKYGWGLSDYLRHYGEKMRELVGASGGSDLILLDDGELLWSYGSAYRNLIRDLRGRQIVGAFREFDVDTATILFGDGFTIYLQRLYLAPAPAVKAPFGLGFLGKTVEVIVL
ncbi:MAG: ATP-binding protein, partial [Pyrobaculum sp.]|nr:ATP-binding protein [Pyrobaculum sp.]